MPERSKGEQQSYADNKQRETAGDTVSGNILYAANVQTLLEIPTIDLQNGIVAIVGGYKTAGDGGGKWVRYEAASFKPDNGGTVHNPHIGTDNGGRWETIHSGTADFRWFGIFDATVNADAALKTMVNDEAIRRIEAHTDLNFIRRHEFNRSHIELDFGGHTVTTEGIELNRSDNPFGAVICFRGTPIGGMQTVTLSEPLAELTDTLEVADSAAFAVDDWWHVQVSPNPGGKAQRELDYLLKVTEIIDEKHVRVNYKLGWALAEGRDVTFRKMNPVVGSAVRNMKFVGVPVPPTTSTTEKPFATWDQIGSNPLAYEFAVQCDVSGIRASGVFWPVVMRRYCSHYVTERCELINPVQREWGGTGYLTQQINVLYGHVRDCNTSNARHLNDFTCAAYCKVENCHGDGDDFGPFVTHGQFEHDLVFIGNSGLLSFANSGTTWGDSAKRITVVKHVASRIVAHKKLTDLTLQDCHAYIKAGLPDSGSIWANADGLDMRGCTAEAMVTLSKSSSLSRRKNVIDSCAIGMVSGGELARPIRSGTEQIGLMPVDGDLLVLNSELYNVEDVTIGSVNRLTLCNTSFKGAAGTSGIVRILCKELVIQGGDLSDCGFVFAGAWDKAIRGNTVRQSVTISGTVFNGTNRERAFMKSVEPNNAITWNIADMTSTAADADTAHFDIEGGSHQYRATGSTFIGGKFAIRDSAFGSGSYMYYTSCLEQSVERLYMPAEAAAIRHSEGNWIVR